VSSRPAWATWWDLVSTSSPRWSPIVVERAPDVTFLNGKRLICLTEKTHVLSKLHFTLSHHAMVHKSNIKESTF
jgi:hypothetical protein